MVFDIGRDLVGIHLYIRGPVEVRLDDGQAASPGSSGNIQRIGCVTEKTQRPPGFSTLATSLMAPAESATNGIAPNAEKAASNALVRNGSSQTSALDQRHPDPATTRTGHRVAQHAGRHIEGNYLRALSGEVAGTGCRAAADLEDAAAGDCTEQADVLLADVLRTPDEVGVTQEGAVFEVVLVGVGIPPAPVGRSRGED